WYPLLPYSPEYVAMKEAAKMGIEVIFIDLPYHALIASAAERDAQMARIAEARGEESDAPSWEAAAVESAFYRSLCEAAGYGSWNECWDALFEAPERFASYEDFRAELAYFCAALRLTTTRERMERDGTYARETHMLETIRATLQKKKLVPDRAMVVCGGFH